MNIETITIHDHMLIHFNISYFQKWNWNKTLKFWFIFGQVYYYTFILDNFLINLWKMHDIFRFVSSLVQVKYFVYAFVIAE